MYTVRIYDTDGNLIAEGNDRRAAISCAREFAPGKHLVGEELVNGRWVGFFVTVVPAALGM